VAGKLMTEDTTEKKDENRKKKVKDTKKELYDPLYSIMGDVVKQMKNIELDIPIAKIAWMEVRGKFLGRKNSALRADTMDFLKVANEYRRIYWNIIKLARRKFEVEMIKDGSYAPDVREYESLKNEIPFVFLKGNKQLWISSYDDYLPKIRERSTKHKKKPRKGATMYRAIYSEIKEVRNTFKLQHKEVLEYARKYRRRLKNARTTPDKKYEYWLENDNISEIKQSGSKSNGYSENDRKNINKTM